MMFTLKLDGTGGTDVVLHYIPESRIEGMLILHDSEAECYCLDVIVRATWADDEGDAVDSFTLTTYSSTDLQEVIAFADALAERTWGAVVDVGEIRERMTDVVGSKKVS